jgi:hypothetical protein
VASHLFHNRVTRNGFSLILLLAMCLGLPVLAKEAVVAEVGLSFTIADDWIHEIEEATTPTGRPVRHWVRRPLSYRGQRTVPRITVWTVPVEDSSELVDLTVDTLSRPPFETTLGVVECLKCVTARLPRQGAIWLPRIGPTKAFAGALSHQDWPDCQLGKVADYHAGFRLQELLGVNQTVVYLVCVIGATRTRQ